MPFSRELFIETIEKIRQQYVHDIMCSNKLKDVFPNAFTPNLMYENHLIMNQRTGIYAGVDFKARQSILAQQLNRITKDEPLTFCHTCINTNIVCS